MKKRVFYLSFVTVLVLSLGIFMMYGCDGDGSSGSGDSTNTYYEDADNDGYGNPNVSQNATSQPDEYVTDNTDCDDTDASIYPGAPETCEDGIDQDCNGNDALCTDDIDEDGYTVGDGDCNDNDADINPGVEEICDDVDNNCDGQIDEGFMIVIYYQDSDGDGYGNPEVSQDVCSQPDGYVTDNNDCDDNDASINPGAEEIPDDSIDNDCDGKIDETDVTINVSEPGDSYDLTGSSARFSDDIDLTDEEDYSDWGDYIKDINITIKYRISENRGDDVTITFYANTFGGDFASATQITEPIEVPAGFEIAAWTNVSWVENEKAYFEDLLQAEHQMTIWIDIVSTGTYDIVLETMYNIKIIANPF